MNNKFGIFLFPWGTERPSIDYIEDYALQAAKLGLDVHTPFHYLLPPKYINAFQNHYCLDALLMLASVARKIPKVKIGINSVVAPLLHPYAWANILATLDNITNGRLIAGIAPGWAQEMGAFKVDLEKRGAITNEEIELIKKLWTEDNVTFHGKFYDIEDCTLEPKPTQKPYPPIWIAGGARPGPFMPAIRRTAKYGELWLSHLATVDLVKKYLPKLKQEAKKQGRNAEVGIVTNVAIGKDRKAVEQVIPPLKTFLGLGGRDPNLVREDLENVLLGTPDEVIKRVRRYLDAGVSYFILDCQLHGMATKKFALEQIELMAKEVIPRL